MRNSSVCILFLVMGHSCSAMQKAPSAEAEEKNKFVNHCESYLYDLSAELEEKEKIILDLQLKLENNTVRLETLQELLDKMRLSMQNVESSKNSYSQAYGMLTVENRRLRETIETCRQSGGDEKLAPACGNCLEMHKILVSNINGTAQSKNDSQIMILLMRRVAFENEKLKKRVRELELCCPTKK